MLYLKIHLREDTLKIAKTCAVLNKLYSSRYYMPRAQKKYFCKPNANFYAVLISPKTLCHRTHKKERQVTLFVVLNEYVRGLTKPYRALIACALKTQMGTRLTRYTL